MSATGFYQFILLMQRFCSQIVYVTAQEFKKKIRIDETQGIIRCYFILGSNARNFSLTSLTVQNKFP